MEILKTEALVKHRFSWPATSAAAVLSIGWFGYAPEREWAYDRNSSVGCLDKGLGEAQASGWTLVHMKNDWKTIFPFGSK